MGLFLPSEKMWDMPLGGASDEKQVPHWFGNIAYGVGGAVFKLFFRYRVDGRKSLRDFIGHSGVLIAAPHASYLDVAFMYLATRTPQWIRFMGYDGLFEHAHGLLGQILTRLGGFPIKRDFADRKAIKRAVRMLKKQEVIGIFPEGTRRGKGNKVPGLHSGAALIARMAGVPILPMAVRDVERVKQKGRFLRFPKITMEFGTPVLVGDFDFLPKDERLDGCVWYVMRECFALKQRVAPEDVDMQALFPKAKYYGKTFAAHPVPRHTTAELCAGAEDAEGSGDGS